METQLLNYKLGKEYPLGFTLWGVLIVVFGFGLMLDWILWGMIPIMLGLGMVMSYSGVQLDPQARKVKDYTWTWFMKLGKWQSLKGYNDVIVLRSKKTFSFGMHGGYGASMEASQVDYEVFIVNGNHFSRILICRKRNQDAAYREARTIATKMDCELVRYNPGRKRRRVVLQEKK